MRDDRGVPLSPSQVTLETPFTDSIGLPEGEPFRAVLDQLEATLLRLGIEAIRSRRGDDDVLSYRCSVGDAFRLRYGRERPRELEDALLREYPWLQPERGELRRRLESLRATAERRERRELAAPMERRARRRSTLS